ncbi:transglutaminase domain-containing protein [Altibacter sp.]|uniref:transglutaminase-like domain-containing protein n=1 Tax=Altibacter sp. TaxID=2024823 RepID=UPI000C8B7AD1|nr:transglutaminase domain-containing protein [Altibacter sp.]MAP54133.1 transglutaminase [Altibacter sp.]
MTRIYCFLLAGLISAVSYSQRKSDPLPEDVSLAQQLRKEFQKEELVVLDKITTISFDRNKRDGLVEAIKKQATTLLNINTSSRVQFPIFYDSQSEVERFTVKDHRGKDLSPSINDEHLKSNEFFHSDYRVRFANINLPLQGYRVVIETEKKYKDVKYFTSEYFTGEYRILQGTLVIEIPEWLDLEILEFNFEGYQIEKTSSRSNDGQKVTYVIKDMEPQSNEANTPGPSYIYPHVLFIAKAFHNGSQQQTLFNSVEDLFGWYNSLVESVEVDASVFADKVTELTAGAISEEEKVKNIFYWVQDNIRYVAFEDGIAGFQPDSPQNVYTKRYGDCKGMAILTKAMLEEAGFDSRLVWIGTDRLAYDYSIPSLTVDNHMICSVILDDETIFLDGTEKYNKYGEYATRIQNKQALLQDTNGYKILTVPAEKGTKNIDKTIYSLRIDGDVMQGTARKEYAGESRVSFQNVYTSFGSSDKEEVLPRFLASGNSNYIVKDIKPFNEEDRDTDLTIEYDVRIENAVSSFDETIYIDIDPIKMASDMLFKERKSDFKFQIKEQQITEIVLEIPQGYRVDMPQDIEVVNDWVDINVQYSLDGNILRYTKDINFKKRLVKKQHFDAWNAGFETLKENLNQQITLTKE